MRYTNLQPGDLVFYRNEPEPWVYEKDDGTHAIHAFSLAGGKKVKRTMGLAWVRRGAWSFAGPVRK